MAFGLRLGASFGYSSSIVALVFLGSSLGIAWRRSPAFVAGGPSLHRARPSITAFEEGKQVMHAPTLSAPQSMGYVQRFSTLLERNDPRMLLAGKPDAEAALRLLELPDGVVADNKRKWAERVQAASMHPTGSYIPRLLRNAAFPLVSIPIVMAFLAASTSSAVVMVQLFNQTYNSCFNRAHAARVGDKKKTALLNFLVATAVACIVAVQGSRLIQDLRADAVIARVCVAYASVVAADIVNIGFNRRNELTKGVVVADELGRPLGASRAAGRAAVVKALLTRSLLLPAVGLALPPAVMAALQALSPCVLPGAAWGAVLEALIVGFTLYIGFPACTAVFPQSLRIATKKLDLAAQEEIDQTAKSYGATSPPSAVYVYRGI